MVLTEIDDSPGISTEELVLLESLLSRMKSTQMVRRVWHALIRIFPTVPLELIVLDAQDRVLLLYREDEEFSGWHHPGSVWNDWETIPERLQKLIAGEINKTASIQISEPHSIGWMGIYRGKGPDDNPSRNECALIYVARLVGRFIPKERVKFFPLNKIPKNTLGHHKYILRRVAQYIKDGIPLCD